MAGIQKKANPEKSKLQSFVLLGSQDTIRDYRIRHRHRYRHGGRPATCNLRLGNKVSQDDKEAPFGGTMPRATVCGGHPSTELHWRMPDVDG